jgi:endonuclease/exonuclease/phosphatase family metal-dependent hydrolase
MVKNFRRAYLLAFSFAFVLAVFLSVPFNAMAAERVDEQSAGAAAETSKASAALNSGGIALKVISYNIAAGQGVVNDSKKYVGKKYLDEIVKLMNAEKADLIGMQEVDDNRFTTRFIDEAKYIASRIGMHYYWHEASAVGPFGKLNKHGNSVMTKHKIIKKECVEYKSKGKKSDGGASAETRAFTYALVEIKGVRVNFISTHLGFPEYARVGQAKELIEYIKKLKGPVIVVGDFNTTQGSESYKIITSYLSDSYAIAASKGAAPTSPAEAPKNRIDFVFVSKTGFTCEKAYAGGDNYNNASDHRPFFALLKLKTATTASSSSRAAEASSENASQSSDESTKILDLQKSLFNAK